MKTKIGFVQDLDYFRSIVDAYPTPVFIVNNDVGIIDYNLAASKLLGPDKESLLLKRGGDILNCVHSKESTEGCGRAEFCKNCVIRNSVNKTFENQTVSREKTKFEFFDKNKKINELHFWVTASPFHYKDKKFALLVLEDITEIMQLRSLIPICANCKKVRDDKDYWHHVDSYLQTIWDADITHSICPDCSTKLYPELAQWKALKKNK
ncbi:MAG: PAS domain-containing protein [Pseudomonadota bacterium]